MKDLDNKNNVSHDLIGEATRAKHIMNIVECEDAHGNTPLSEASSKLTYLKISNLVWWSNLCLCTISPFMNFSCLSNQNWYENLNQKYLVRFSDVYMYWYCIIDHTCIAL